MEAKRKMPKITASSKEEYEEIEGLLNSLHLPIFDEIISAEKSLMGITFTYKTLEHGNYAIPNDISQITNFGDYYGIYSKTAFFKIPIEKFKSLILVNPLKP